MVRNGHSFRHRIPLIVFDATLTAQHYINEVLRSAVVLFFSAHCDVTEYQQDDARIYSARLMTACLLTSTIRHQHSSIFHVIGVQLNICGTSYQVEHKEASSTATDTLTTGSSIAGRMDEHTASPNKTAYPLYVEEMPCGCCSRQRTH